MIACLRPGAMSEQRRQIKEAVRDALSRHADATYSSAGFRRRSDSLTYKRTLPTCKQFVDVHIEHGPRDMPNAAAAIYPFLRLEIPEIDATVLEITGGDESLASNMSTTLNQPIELVAPKGIGARWFLYQPDSVGPAIQNFEAFSTQWVLPFLNDYTSAASVVEMYLAKDDRASNDLGYILRVVAAMVRIGKLTEAQEVLAAKFGRPASRRKYARVFEFIEERIANSTK